MQDEHFIRQWNQVHDEFTGDLHDTLEQIANRRQARGGSAEIIGSPYDRILDRRPAEAAARELSPVGQASLRGLAASVITLALWVVVMLVATPAPGLASTLDAPLAQVGTCVDAPVLA